MIPTEHAMVISLPPVFSLNLYFGAERAIVHQSPIGVTDREWTFVDGSIELVISACDRLGVSSILTNTKLMWLLRLASLWG
jgi:hypothetical protein